MDEDCKSLLKNLTQIFDRSAIEYNKEKFLEESCDITTVNALLEEVSLEQRKSSAVYSKSISQLTHKLKTPVGAVLWNVEMLLSGDYGDLTESQREILQETYDLSKQMNERIITCVNHFTED